MTALAPSTRASATQAEALRAHGKLPLILGVVLAVVMIVSCALAPAGVASWFLEVGPALPGILILLLTYRRFPMSHLVYVGIFVHVLILIYGGMYTYAETPLGNWARDTFGWSRNHYDRVGHLALGVFPCFTIRELLLRLTPLVRGGWLVFLVLSVVLAIGAFWELLEWWVTLIVASDVGAAFLGSQGDVWDAQWDMFLALVGAAVALALASKAHDRSLAAVTDR